MNTSDMKICYADIDGEETEIEIKIGNTYYVVCIDTGDTGDIICEFTSKLKDVILDDEDNTEIDKLVFENGVTIYQPQYHDCSISISLE